MFDRNQEKTISFKKILETIYDFLDRKEGLKNFSSFSEVFKYIADQYDATILGTEKRDYNISTRLYGMYHTPYDLARIIIERTLSNEKDLEKRTFLEPCNGLGAFTLNYIDFVLKNFKSKKDNEYIKRLLRNIFVVDIDEYAITIYKLLLKLYLRMEWSFELSDDILKGQVSSEGLIFSKSFERRDLKGLFGSHFEKADIIITNPPYYNLRFVTREWLSKSQIDKAKNYIERVSRIIESLNYEYQGKGTKNLYKVFVEEIIFNYSSYNAKIGLLIPYSFLTSVTNKEFRTVLMKKGSIVSVQKVSENIKNLFPVGQNMVIIEIDKAKSHDRIKIFKPIVNKTDLGHENVHMDISLNKLNKFTQGYEIPDINETSHRILEKMHIHNKIKDIKHILNRRGEVDVNFQKRFISHSKDNNGVIMIRGVNISKYKPDYSTVDYLDKASRVFRMNEKIIKKYRIACNQISNMSSHDRLKCALVKDVALANSCNYIHTEDFKEMLYLIGIMNSSLLEWRFRVFSSNNHISNYEIGELPIPLVKDKNYWKIIDIVKKLLEDKDTNESLEQDLDSIVFNIYNIEEKDRLYILHCLYNHSNKLYNHFPFRLSSLDMEIIKSVKREGDNWTKLPPDIINKSERLKKISITGGRTTLYARLRWNKPSYTINTYFYRPGNGAHIHPGQDRVITAREAARLQSFPDNYVFLGSKISIAKQIGNAIPPLMSYAVVSHIKDLFSLNTAVDLFCGAGGSEVGLKMSGIKTIVANDIDRYACETYMYNNPEVAVVCGNISSKEIQKKILDNLKDNDVDLVIGGPPCQGFSLAGKRLLDDPRNYLFIPFLELLKKISPKVVIMENVPGILSINHGVIFENIKDLFSKIGYKVYAKILETTHYGVPQIRRRVFLLGVKNIILRDKHLSDSDLFPRPIFFDKGREDYKLFYELREFTTVYDAISDLPLPSNNNYGVKYRFNDPNKLTPYQRLMRGMIDVADFYKNK